MDPNAPLDTGPSAGAPLAGMTRLIAGVVHRPVSVLMAFCAVLVIGTIAYVRIPVAQMPSGLEPKFLVVHLSYLRPDAGLSPAEVEEEVTKPLEDALASLPNLEELRSTSRPSDGRVVLIFTADADMRAMYAEVKDRVDRVRAQIDTPLNRPRYWTYDPNNQASVVLGVAWSPGTSGDPYARIADLLVPRLENLPGVARVDVRGLIDTNVLIALDPLEIARQNLDPVRLTQTLRAENFTAGAGRVEDGGRRYGLVTDARFSSLAELRAVPLGTGVRLGDVARVGFVPDLRDDEVRLDGQRAVSLEIFGAAAANPLELSDAVQAALFGDPERSITGLDALPAFTGFQFETLYAQGTEIAQSIETLRRTALTGGICAIAILLFFLRRFRLTLLVAMTIPLSLLLAVIVMFFADYSINILSLMGLTLAVGMLVDNAVVVTENIARQRERGLSDKDAAVRGTGEIALAVTLATLTSVCVFLPLILLPSGFIQFFLKNIGVPLCLALGASLIVALVFVPLFGATLARPRTGRAAWPARLAEAIVNGVRRAYLVVLRAALGHRLITALVTIAVFLVTAGASEYIDKTDRPESRPREISVRVRFPEQNTLAEARSAFRDYERALQTLGVQPYAHTDETTGTRVSRPRLAFTHMLSSYDRARGRLRVYMDTGAQWSRAEVKARLLEILPKHPGVRLRIGWNRGGMSGSTNKVGVLLSGPDSTRLAALALTVAARLEALPELSGVETDITDGRPELRYTIDRNLAVGAGVEPRQAALSLTYGLSGTRLSDFHLPSGRTIPIRVEYRKSGTPDQAAVVNQRVPLASGASAPFKSLLTRPPTYSTGYGEIRRQKRRTAIQITANTTDDALDRVSAQIGAAIASLDLPQGYTAEPGERMRRWSMSFTSMDTAFMLALVLVFLIMGFFFESVSLPFTVLLTVPLAFVGVVWILLLTETKLDQVVMVGAVILLGLVVNNGIVMVDLINRRRAEGATRHAALLDAGRHRFRPILMTALTTIVGLIPMALGDGGFFGMPYYPIARAMIGGLCTATLLTLVVIPVAYDSIDQVRRDLRVLLYRLTGRRDSLFTAVWMLTRFAVAGAVVTGIALLIPALFNRLSAG